MSRVWKIAGYVLLIIIAVYILMARKRVATTSDVLRSITMWKGPAQRYASVYAVPWQRILAVLIHETHGEDPLIPGDNEERGLMQVTPGALSDVNSFYHLGLTLEDLYIPDKGIRAGSAYLRMKMNDFGGDLDLATRAYNTGTQGLRDAPDSAGLDYLLDVARIESIILQTST